MALVMDWHPNTLADLRINSMKKLGGDRGSFKQLVSTFNKHAFPLLKCQVLSLCIQALGIAQGLKYLHTMDVVHGDLHWVCGYQSRSFNTVKLR